MSNTIRGYVDVGRSPANVQNTLLSKEESCFLFREEGHDKTIGEGLSFSFASSFRRSSFKLK